MRATMRGVSTMLALALAGPAAAQEPGARFVVLPFENSGSYGQDKEVFEALELGLASMLTRALNGNPGADAVAQDRVAGALRSRKLGAARRIDAATAAQIGDELGARFAVTGTFADFYGKFRLNARLIDARNGQIIEVLSNDDPKLQDRAQLAAIVQSVSEKIVAAAGLPATTRGGAASPVPTDAITSYSRGLLLESRGDREGAAGFYRQALSAFPGFADARSRLDRVQGR